VPLTACVIECGISKTKMRLTKRVLGEQYDSFDRLITYLFEGVRFPYRVEGATVSASFRGGYFIYVTI